MNFKYKCLLQSIFSTLPKGESINYLFQKYITKKLPRGNAKFLSKVNYALLHFENFKEFNKLQTKSNKYYEFGAGWTLETPLAMSFLGFEVYCIDIRKLIIPELIRNSLEKFEINKYNLPFQVESGTNSTFKNKSILEYLEKHYNLYYYAPLDARKTGFEENYFDFISSSVTLEHIPKIHILAILQECYRILKKGGIISFSIDYQDHWSYTDKNISIYNYLKYSEREWKKYNPSLHYQNRLRHSDYIGLISQTDFKIVKESPGYASEEDKEVLKTIKIAKDFENYDFEDLAIRRSELVLIK